MTGTPLAQRPPAHHVSAEQVPHGCSSRECRTHHGSAGLTSLVVPCQQTCPLLLVRAWLWASSGLMEDPSATAFPLEDVFLHTTREPTQRFSMKTAPPEVHLPTGCWAHVLEPPWAVSCRTFLMALLVLA